MEIFPVRTLGIKNFSGLPFLRRIAYSAVLDCCPGIGGIFLTPYFWVGFLIYFQNFGFFQENGSEIGYCFPGIRKVFIGRDFGLGYLGLKKEPLLKGSKFNPKKRGSYWLGGPFNVGEFSF